MPVIDLSDPGVGFAGGPRWNCLLGSSWMACLPRKDGYWCLTTGPCLCFYLLNTPAHLHPCSGTRPKRPSRGSKARRSQLRRQMWHLNIAPKVLPGDGVSGNIAVDNISPETAGTYTVIYKGKSDRQPQQHPDLKAMGDQTLARRPKSWTPRLLHSSPMVTNLFHASPRI